MKTKLWSLLVSLSSILGTFLAAAALGWIVGLSSSPITAAILSSLIAGGLTLAQQRLDTNQSKKIAHVPLYHVACIACGLGVGVPVGIYARSHQWLAASPSHIAARWQDTTISKQDVMRRLLESEFPKDDQESVTSPWDGSAHAEGGIRRQFSVGITSKQFRRLCRTIDNIPDTEQVKQQRDILEDIYESNLISDSEQVKQKTLFDKRQLSSLSNSEEQELDFLSGRLQKQDKPKWLH